MAVTDDPMTLVDTYLHLLGGKKCWSVIAGPGAGSMVSIAVGRQIPRQSPIKNPTLSPLQREFEGEFKVFIQDAEWRLEAHGEAICCNEDDNDVDGPMLLGLNRLLGKTVVSASLTNKKGDFEMLFSEDLRLVVSCISSSDEYLNNYSLSDLEEILVVGGNSRVVVEPR